MSRPASKLGIQKKNLDKMSNEEKEQLKYNLVVTAHRLKNGPVPPPKPSKPHTRKANRIPSDESPRSVRSKGGYNYFNQEKSIVGGRKTIRKVSIKNGKGHKSITQYKKNKKMFSDKKPLSMIEIVTIQRGQFIPGLFSDCKGPGCMKNKTRKTH